MYIKVTKRGFTSGKDFSFGDIKFRGPFEIDVESGNE